MTFHEFLARRRKWLIAAAALFSLGLATLALLPQAIRYGLIAAIEATEAGRTAAISDVDYNPFTGRLTIHDLALQGAEGRGAEVRQLFVEIENRAIWRKRIYLRQLRIDGAALDIDLDGTLRIAGFALPDGAGPAETDSGWRGGVDHLEIRDSKVTLHAGGRTETLAIDAGNGKPFLMWAENSAGDLTADVDLPGGRLRIDGTARPFQSEPGFDVSMKSDGVRLGPLLALLPQAGLPALDATLATDLRFRADGGNGLRISGTLGADGIRLDLPDRKDPLTLQTMALKNIDAEITFRPQLAMKLTGAMTASDLRAPLPGQDRLLTADTFSLDTTGATLDFDEAGRLSLQGDISLSAGALNAPLAADGSARTDIAWNGTVGIRITGTAPGIKTDGSLKLEDISVAMPESGMTVTGGQAGFTGRMTFDSGQDGNTLDLRGDIETGALAYTTNDMNVAIESAALPGAELRVTPGADGGMTVTAGGKLETRQLTAQQAASDGAAGPELAIGRIALNDIVSALTLTEGRAEIQFDGHTVASDITARQGDRDLANDRLAWNGTLRAVIPDAGAASARATGRLESGRLTLTTGVSGIRLRQDSAGWDGEIALSLPPDGAVSVSHAMADVNMGAVHVASEALGLRLLDFAGLRLDGLSREGEAIRAKGLTIDDITALSPQTAAGETPGGPRTIALRRLHLTAIDYREPGRLTADTAVLTGASLHILRQKDGAIDRVDSLLQLVDSLSRGDGDTAGTATPFTFAIERTELTGDSRLLFTDNSVAPAVQMTLAPIKAEITGIDSAQPDRPADLTLTSSLDKYSTIAVSGQTQPFAERLNASLTGKVTGFDLATVSPYASHYLGYDFRSGRLDMDIDAKIIDGKLDTTSTLTINKLDTAPTNPELLAPLNNRLEVPIDTALSLLRDSNDMIRLNVPVQGDITNPQFDFSNAINQAIGGAIKSTMTTLLKVAFPIGGLILTVVDSAGNTQLMIEPVPFADGEAGLLPDARSHLDNVAKLLNERPKVRLTACAQVTERDRAALLARMQQDAARKAAESRAAESKSAAGRTAPNPPAPATPPKETITVPESDLLALARQRNEAVKDDLIGRHKIDESRLFLCAPGTAPATESDQPRVDLRF